MKRLKNLMPLMVLLIGLVLQFVAAVPLNAGEIGLFVATTSPITLPTQKMVFLSSLKEEYENIDTWLNEVQSLDAFVEDGQTLVFPEAGADPLVYTDMTGDIDAVEPFETIHTEELHIYDSQNYKLRNWALHALPFEKIQFYTKKSANAIIKKEIADAAYNFAPENTNEPKQIIIPTTGNMMADGNRALIVEDIITMAERCDKLEFPDNRHIVLPSDMWWQLVNSNDILKGQLKQQQANGVINYYAVEYFGIKIHKSLGDKLGVTWDKGSQSQASHKAPQGTLPGGNVVPCALFFCANEVFKAGGKMEMFHQDKSTNPTGRAYEFGFQHRFMTGFPVESKRYVGLIYADNQ